jgi:mannose-6-phosphate isomerase-like protein (cupin superfamily)
MKIVSKRFARSGLLTPETAKVLRARSVILGPGRAIDWHTTDVREELVLAMAGLLLLETGVADGVGGARRRVHLAAGRCCFLPRRTWHRIVNRSHRHAHYLYITAPRRLEPAGEKRRCGGTE